MPLLRDILVQASTAAGAEAAAVTGIVDDALARQRSPVQAVLEAEMVEERPFLQKIADLCDLPWWPAQPTLAGGELQKRLPLRVALQHQLLVAGERGEALQVLTFDPFDLLAKQRLAQALGQPVEWAMHTRRDILQALRKGYGIGADTFEELLEKREDEEILDHLKDEVQALDDQDDSEASVVKFVNQIMREALMERATDIHFEPVNDALRIRYRIDGMLHEVPVPALIARLQDSVVARLKIMSHLDIAERRLPQDGRIALEFEGQPIDVRVATIPTVTGENVSLRLLGQQKFTFERLGISGAHRKQVDQLLAKPNGIVLITGPTGSGKSTSLYTFLTALNAESRRIVTIEDPVENKLPGVLQIAVRPEIDLTFARGLRAILRGDPNVVMIGEMRDLETAEIAIRAALTGHLVFSTLHTNDAIGGITRLIDMGIEPFLVSTSVRAFIAQRLVRRLCDECKTDAAYPPEYLEQLGFALPPGQTIYKAAGCDACRQTGYQGRTAIFEICMVSPRLQDMIAKNHAHNDLQAVAVEEGMEYLRENGWSRVLEGVTTLEEVLRVTAEEGSH
ncbi:MAG TPA: GspE/PulE family protein [Chthoniobacteraceae bacterium]|nr:GspE/PulE family protein [Chthoniobacteraceae bacterium]